MFALLKHSALLLVVALAVVPLTNASIVVTDLAWGGKDEYGIIRIRVCVDNGSSPFERGKCGGCNHDPNPSLDEVVRNVRSALFKGWEQHSSIRFYDWRKCKSLNATERDEAMQLYIHPETGNFANLGTQSRGARKGVNFKPWGNAKKCIYYDALTAKMKYEFDCARQYGIHEVGHALGLEHEWRHPLKPDKCTNRPASEPKYSSPQSFDKIVNPTYYDLDSIMTYDDKCADVTGVRFGSQWPTLTDRAGLVRTYPRPKVSDIRLVDWVFSFCIDINLNTRGAYMNPCNLGDNQLFSFDWTNSTIRSPAFQDLCLDAAKRNGNVYMGPCHGGDNQKWQYYPTGEIKNVQYDQCLTMVGTLDLAVLDCNKGFYQKFSQPADDVSELRSPFGKYARCLDIHPETKVVYYYIECHNQKNQKFYYDPTTKKITSPYVSNSCLDVATDGSNIVYMYPCHNGTNQNWNYNDGTGELTNEWAPGKCVDIDLTNNLIYVKTCNGGDNQKLVFFGYRN